MERHLANVNVNQRVAGQTIPRARSTTTFPNERQRGGYRRASSYCISHQDEPPISTCYLSISDDTANKTDLSLAAVDTLARGELLLRILKKINAYECIFYDPFIRFGMPRGGGKEKSKVASEVCSLVELY
ncbi:hypothetical protein WN51_05035 [Melipona quadrifasciata]|uniref:Uncharacterized protein n=1 Tax=Melipona quadrifasciata TaxID=166423 RepID=A0A0M8ZRP5_9HYME|nr:hypothetical protein WN51_05035 [Melipona quadrifasciata]